MNMDWMDVAWWVIVSVGVVASAGAVIAWVRLWLAHRAFKDWHNRTRGDSK